MKTAYDVILRPVITEKSMAESAEKKYVFEVAPSANKTEIKAAIAEIFGVKVKSVNTVNVQGKRKRSGSYPMGRTAAKKKAYVELTEDSKTIEFFEGMV
jgi:large subunit ribosomal protein L23